MAEEIETLEAPVVESPAGSGDRAELEANVAEGLAKVFTDDSEEIENVPEDKGPEKPVPPHLKPPAETEDESAVSADAEKPDATETKPAEKEAAPDKGSTLPEAYRRSLKAYEWTDYEIKAALGTPGFLETAAKIHATRVKEVQHFAELGRKAKATQTQAAAPAAETALTPVDVAALQKIYGADEALIGKMAEPVNQAIARINAIMPKIQAAEAIAQQQQLETFGKQLDVFFGTSDSVETYGKTAATATETQLAARIKTVELADALIAGGRQQGRNLSMDEALQMAYDATTSVSKTQTARAEIKKTLQARERSITLKPTARASIPTKVTDRAGLESRVKQGLAKAFS